MSRYRVLPCALLFAAIGPMSAAEMPVTPEDWALGPFVKLERPVLEPNPAATFRCPVAGKTVRWEAQNVYNPAAVVRDGKVWLLYRADDEPRQGGWGRTCRIGLAISSDGRQFTRHPEPVIYPDNDAWKRYEWELHGFTPPAVVANGLVYYRGEWLLYYGAADRRIGLAVCRAGE